MRLKKDERERCKQTIRQFKTAKTVSLREYNFAWFRLKTDYYFRLCLDLKHISDIPFLDILEANAVDGEKLFSTNNYLKHFSPDEIKILREYITDARKGLDYLTRLLDGI